MGNLKKQTKTILLHNGMQDDVDDFLIESPAVEYVENGVFDKQGVISKRYGRVALPDMGVDDGTPVTMAGGDVLLVPSADALNVYDPLVGEWESIASDATFTTVERALTTEAFPGATEFSSVEVGDYVVVAFTLAKDATGFVWDVRHADVTAARPTISRDVVVEIYLNGRRINRRIYTDRHSPRLAGLSSRWALVTMCNNDTVYYANVDCDFNSIQTGSSLVFDVNENIDTFPVGNVNSYAPAQPYGLVVNDCNYFMCATATRVYIVYTTSANHVSVKRYNRSTTGVLTISGTHTLFTCPTAGANESNSTRVLGFCVDAPSGTPTKGYVLFSATEWDLGVGGSDTIEYDAKVLEFTLSSGAVAWTTTLETDTLYPGAPSISTNYQISRANLPLHGSVCMLGDREQITLAYTLGPISIVGLPTLVTGGGSSDEENIDDEYLEEEQPRIPKTRFFRVTVSSGSDIHLYDVYGYRLASNLAIDSSDSSGDGKTYVALQQWGLRASMISGEATDTVTHPDTYRPMTTILCSVPRGTSDVRPVPIACLGTNRGLTTPSYDSGMCGHLPTLYVSPYIFGEQYILLPVPTDDSVTDAGYQRGDTRGYTIRSVGLRKADVSRVLLEQTPRVLPARDGAVLAGGLPMWFDGARLSELSPICFPDIFEVEVYQSTANHMLGTEVDPPAANYAFKAVFQFVDRAGVVHRSAAGPAVYVPHSYSGNVRDIALFITTPLTLMRDNDSFSVEVYQLVSGIYKNVASQHIDLSDDASTPTIIRFTVDPDRATASKTLYTDGGLDADVIPAVSRVATTGRRLVALTEEAGPALVYSKRFSESYSPEFPVTFRMPLTLSGAPTGVGVMDDKIVVFTTDSTSVLYGDGPDDLGRGQGFGIVQVSSTLGCIDEGSIASISDGVIFRSRSGMMLLGRDLSLVPVGGADDLLVGSTIISNTTVAARDEVRFLLTNSGTTTEPATSVTTTPPRPKFGNAYSAGTALVYNTRQKQWSVFTNYAAIASSTLNGQHAILRSDWSVWLEDGSTFADPSGDNLLKIITPWVKLNGVQSYGRIWSATFLGRYLSTFVEDDAGNLDAGDVTIKVAYDYEKDDTQTHVFRASEELQPELRDGVTVSADRLQIKVVPKRQKCSAIRFTIEETDTADADGLTYRPGQGFEIPAIELELGMKDTANKSLSAQRKK